LGLSDNGIERGILSEADELGSRKLPLRPSYDD
jgi:hypothetical protein